MAVLGARRKWVARAFRACAWTGIALLLSCGGGSTSPPGTPVVTLADTSGDFASYRVLIDSITLTATDGSVVEPLLTAESVDLAALSDMTELLEVPAVPSGTYKSATLTLDYSSAGVFVNVNGQLVLAKVVDSAGAAMTTETVTVTFDPNHPYVVTNGQASRLAINVDLAASNSIDTATSPPTVTVFPFLVMTPAPLDSTVMRARGLFVTVPAGKSQFIMNVRPLIDLVSALGAINVDVDSNTYYNINGITYTGAAGLAVVAALQESTTLAAFGTLTSFSGITPTMHATSVYAGSSLESPLQDEVTGVVSARSGDTFTVHGATLITRLGVEEYANSISVSAGTGTVVSEDGVNAAGLSLASVSVGQQVTISGQAAVATNGDISLDATSGQVRLASTRLWGNVSSASGSSATLDLLTLENFAPSTFTFTGTGTPIANPAAYQVNTGTLTAQAGVLTQIDGLVAPFGAAPPDFNATALTAGAATEQRLIVAWTGAGSAKPFSSVSTSGLVVNLSDANLGSVHEIRTGPASLDIKTLPPLLITTVGADPSQLQLAVGNNTLSTGVSVFNSAAAFVTGLNAAFNGTNKIYRLVAVGQLNSAANTFVATRISVSLEE